MLFTVEIDKDFHQVLKKLAKTQERSMASTVRFLIKEAAKKEGLLADQKNKRALCAIMSETTLPKKLV